MESIIIIIIVVIIFLVAMKYYKIENFSASGGTNLQLNARDPQDTYEIVNVDQYYPIDMYDYGYPHEPYYVPPDTIYLPFGTYAPLVTSNYGPFI
ncbi:MAG: hypothetical protein Edafosvirus4_31 [Edafosvirus sp.]|uniref:Uncharacterized protein n=1 Tax=Edafosvirus sp. TaxID=2487765 RepID=A0A3G4ZT41_9VIRU|nr:MAG: hypothetical protein Edafosvirus4_31 [Edafosvirus sp.]